MIYTKEVENMCPVANLKTESTAFFRACARFCAVCCPAAAYP